MQAFMHVVDAHVGHYDYLMKTDDDSHVHVDEVKNHIGKFLPHYWGCLYENTKPIRDEGDKWFISNEIWPDEYYPTYAGMFYA